MLLDSIQIFILLLILGILLIDLRSKKETKDLPTVKPSMRAFGRKPERRKPKIHDDRAAVQAEKKQEREIRL